MRRILCMLVLCVGTAGWADVTVFDTVLGKLRMQDITDTDRTNMALVNSYGYATDTDLAPSLVPSVTVYIDMQRTDTYVEDGTISRPYKSMPAALASVSKASVIHVAPGTYTVSGGMTLPNYPLVIYGNNATIVSDSDITVPNATFVRYDLNTVGNVVFSSSAAGRVLAYGGSITGNVTLNGLTDFKSVTLLGGTVTVNSTAQLLGIFCTFTSRVVGTGRILLENNNFNTGKTTPLVYSTSPGSLVLVNNIITNTSTGGAVYCDNGATTVPNMVSNNALTTVSGNAVECGTAVTYYSKNIIYGGLSGTGFLPINSDLIDAAGIFSAVSTKTDSDTIAVTDSGKFVRMNKGSANTLNINSDLVVPMPIGATIRVAQIGTGTTTIDAVATVLLNGTAGGKCDVSGQWKQATLQKTGINTWDVYGDVGVVSP